MDEGSYYFCETIIHFDDLPGKALEEDFRRFDFRVIKVKGSVGGYSFIHQGDDTDDMDMDTVIAGYLKRKYVELHPILPQIEKKGGKLYFSIVVKEYSPRPDFPLIVNRDAVDILSELHSYIEFDRYNFAY